MDFRSICRHPDVDLVCVATPNPHHRVEAAAALEAGKHVLCEKPLAMNIQETRELIQLAEGRPKQVALVNHQLRFNPYIRKVRDLIAHGAIGQPYYLRLHQQSTGFADRHARWTWSFDGSQGGGVRLAMASHLIDLVHFWFGERIHTVCGTMDPVVRQRRDHSGKTVDVKASGSFCASLELHSGMAVHLFATGASCGSSAFAFSLYGDEGELHFDLVSKLTGSFLSRAGVAEAIPVSGVTERERTNSVSIFSGSFEYFAAAIARAIGTGDWGELELAAKFRDADGVQVVLDALRVAANKGVMERLAGHERSDDLV
jgi:predicted dehydrogenase